MNRGKNQQTLTKLRDQTKNPGITLRRRTGASSKKPPRRSAAEFIGNSSRPEICNQAAIADVARLLISTTEISGRLVDKQTKLIITGTQITASAI